MAILESGCTFTSSFALQWNESRNMNTTLMRKETDPFMTMLDLAQTAVLEQVVFIYECFRKCRL